jgi:orotidine-5'-phosphate decarboxylase
MHTHSAVLVRRSGVVLALDAPSIDASMRLLEDVADLVDAVKLGWFQLLEHGPQGVLGIIRRFPEIYFLADLKIADVDHVNSYIVRRIVEMNFKGLIMHSFIGSINLKSPIGIAHSNGVDVYLLVSMSTGGELYDAHLDRLVRMGVELGVDGFVVPATKPWAIRRTREIAGDKHILSPGVGPQGASPGCAIANGADFEIMGRLLMNDPRPRDLLIEVIKSRGTRECSP